jgi:polyisoprenoid-binding protein YceI
MNLKDLHLPNLSALDKMVIFSIGETPLQLLFDKFGYPSESAVTRVTGAIGWDPNDYLDRVNVYLSIRSIRDKVAKRQAKMKKTAPKPQPQSLAPSQPEAQPA